ncbi:MAG: amidohydrolase family protein [Chitinophagaceae bacterium]|nr:amidohydrolase family protein [Chitinophagaceae bacterium]
MVYMGSFVKDFWDYRKDFRFKSWTAVDFEQTRQEYLLKLKITKMIYDAGIPILAGTDFPNPHCYIGFGLHDEMELLVKAGLSPAAALQTATINPAKYFDIASADGSVTINKNANLILLTKNPLQDINNTRLIDMVFVKGKPFTATQLQDMLESVKKMLAMTTAVPSHTGIHIEE